MNAAASSGSLPMNEGIPPSRKFNRDVKMQATSLKESNLDPSTKTTLNIDPANIASKRKPPQINQDLTNKVF